MDYLSSSLQYLTNLKDMVPAAREYLLPTPPPPPSPPPSPPSFFGRHPICLTVATAAIFGIGGYLKRMYEKGDKLKIDNSQELTYTSVHFITHTSMVEPKLQIVGDKSSPWRVRICAGVKPGESVERFAVICVLHVGGATTWTSASVDVSYAFEEKLQDGGGLLKRSVTPCGYTEDAGMRLYARIEVPQVDMLRTVLNHFASISIKITEHYPHVAIPCNGAMSVWKSFETSPLNDVTLVVEGTEMRAVKKVLALNSSVFFDLFYGERANLEQSVYVLQNFAHLADLTCEDLSAWYAAIIPGRSRVTMENVKTQLKVAKRLRSPGLVEECAAVLCSDRQMDVCEKLLLADDYALVDVQEVLINCLTDAGSIQHAAKFGKDRYSDDLKCRLCDRLSIFEKS